MQTNTTYSFAEPKVGLQSQITFPSARSSIFGYNAAGRVNMTVGEGTVTPQDYSYTAGTNKSGQHHGVYRRRPCGDPRHNL